MRTYQDSEWTTLDVRAQDRASAVRAATGEARRSGWRVADVAAATRQPESHRWHVELRVEGR